MLKSSVSNSSFQPGPYIGRLVSDRKKYDDILTRKEEDVIVVLEAEGKVHSTYFPQGLSSKGKANPHLGELIDGNLFLTIAKENDIQIVPFKQSGRTSKCSSRQSSRVATPITPVVLNRSTMPVDARRQSLLDQAEERTTRFNGIATSTTDDLEQQQPLLGPEVGLNGAKPVKEATIPNEITSTTAVVDKSHMEQQRLIGPEADHNVGGYGARSEANTPKKEKKCWEMICSVM